MDAMNDNHATPQDYINIDEELVVNDDVSADELLNAHSGGNNGSRRRRTRR
jgi:hypothetical protein